MAERIETLQPPSRTYTDEELDAAGEEARQLMKLKSINNVAQLLCYARQLYMIGKVMLQQTVQAADGSEVGFEAIVRAMNHFAHSDPENTSEAMLAKKLPHVIEVLKIKQQLDAERAAEEDAQQQKTEDMRRREQEITLASLGLPPLSRKKSVVLAGHPGVLRFVLGRILSDALAENGHSEKDRVPRFANVAIRLVHKLRQAELSAKKDKLSVDVGVNSWLATAANWRTFDRAIMPWLKQLRGNRVDLLLAEDAVSLYSGFAQASTFHAVASVQQALRKWGDASGTGIVLGVQTAELSPTLPDEAAVDELRKYARLHVLSAVPAEGEQAETHFYIKLDGNVIHTVDRKIVLEARSSEDAE